MKCGKNILFKLRILTTKYDITYDLIGGDKEFCSVRVRLEWVYMILRVPVKVKQNRCLSYTQKWI